MNNNDLQMYEDEIQSLEEEIKTLTEEYECSHHASMAYSDEDIMNMLKSSKRKSVEKLGQYESPPDLKTQLELLESDLSFIMKLTGICFTHYSRKPVEKNGTKTTHKYRLSGNCESVPFQVEFQLFEESQVKKNVSAIVTDLNIIIDSEEYSDLSKLVSRVEENGNLLLFFKSLLCFSEWHGRRKCVFTNFKNKYPEVVVLPEGLSGDYMLLRNTQLPGLELMIVWKIRVDEGGNVTPVLDLLHKIPVSVEKANKFALDAPHCFRSLLHVLGIEASIETLIKSFCNGKSV
ncbi:centromere protein P [Sceloporus undulatus]|uniref:centromere protein P n=1 Tax=Sceloporus undulatus TaxID=8520 RepID=UPI001C4AD95D|nr:centromere protein P [Sceloporus undulatus]